MERQAGSPAAVAEPGVTVGVIGTGNMGSALVRGWVRGLGPDARLLVWDKVTAAVQRVSDCAGVVVAESPAQLVEQAAFIVIVVKPKDGDGLLRSIAPLLREGQIVVSSMAGVELEQIRRAAGPRPALFRVMPNLGVELGAGMVAVASEPGGDVEAQTRVVRLFDALGSAVLVPESALDTVTAGWGSGRRIVPVFFPPFCTHGGAGGRARPRGGGRAGGGVATADEPPEEGARGRVRRPRGAWSTPGVRRSGRGRGAARPADASTFGRRAVVAVH